MKKLVFVILIMGFGVLNAQVLDASDPAIAAALGNPAEGNPLANAFQRRTPAMDFLLLEVRNNTKYTTDFVGAEVGSPYENDEFSEGKIYHGEEYLGRFYYRYNIFSKEIEIKKTKLKEEEYKALLKDENIKLVSSDREFCFMEFMTNRGELKKGYLNILSKKGNFTLYQHLITKYSAAEAAANSQVNPKPSRFTTFTEYYFQKDGEEPVQRLASKKKSFLKQLPENIHTKVKSYIKEHNTHLKKEKDLIELFEYINTL